MTKHAHIANMSTLIEYAYLDSTYKYKVSKAIKIRKFFVKFLCFQKQLWMCISE
jgi:hypothetical protein